MSKMKLDNLPPISSLRNLCLVYFLFLSQSLWSSKVVSQSVQEKTKKNGWTSRTNLVCEDHPTRCDFYWSRGWYTCNVGGALWENCPKSCGFCGDKNAPDCKDQRKSGCDTMKKRGFCKTYKAYMKQYCSKTCEMCKAQQKPKIEPGCRDYEDMCNRWVEFGECRKSADVRNYCPKACGMCGDKMSTKIPPKLEPKTCQDTETDVCKTKYLCAHKRNIASKKCRKTCKMCKTYGSCYDLDSLCYWYKFQGHCKPSSAFYNHVTSKCAFSCGICKS
ncbi:zinc metalloproteinase nas-15-like [Clytia hemisphaerica]|uniref:ShKT domain-containing protein n=1 Tax=Clytia hemisphaerica TaxID=252671 RepID=A0A7M5UUP9_9CNID